MDYLTLFSPHNLALLSDWLAETGELYVDVYQVHSGGSGDAYFIYSMRDLKSLIARQDSRELAVTVFRKLQYPLRGVANEDLLKAGLELIPEGEWYTIVSLESVYPSYVLKWGVGNTHEEFRQEFAEVLGKRVGIGQNPFDFTLDTAWFLAHTDEAFYVSYTRHNQFAIVKNQDFYAPYAQNPEKYQWLIDLWKR